MSKTKKPPTPVHFRPLGGTPCPACAAKEHRHCPGDTVVYSGDGRPIRYHRCRICGQTFKSIDSELAPYLERQAAAARLLELQQEVATAQTRHDQAQAEADRAAARAKHTAAALKTARRALAGAQPKKEDTP